MTVDFISLKLYIVKVIWKQPKGREESAMGRIVRFAVQGNAHFSFMQARYAGRYYRGQNSRTG